MLPTSFLFEGHTLTHTDTQWRAVVTPCDRLPSACLWLCRRPSGVLVLTSSCSADTHVSSRGRTLRPLLDLGSIVALVHLKHCERIEECRRLLVMVSMAIQRAVLPGQRLQ